jgi:hypothetical protein
MESEYYVVKDSVEGEEGSAVDYIEPYQLLIRLPCH